MWTIDEIRELEKDLNMIKKVLKEGGAISKERFDGVIENASRFVDSELYYRTDLTK